mmetsp:Transcript_3218/g.9895  ORF Transcript_3218/g.9895 Transcript_3218/m.9895 type:complete len:141 (-) Transcript_3218:670-1092(-)|eukprot:scaffold130457_cov35-Tisochrysis_lutea.AAC.2
MSYFFSGYCPLSARIVGLILAHSPHWSIREEYLRPLPGPLFRDDATLVRESNANIMGNNVASHGIHGSEGGDGDSDNVTLIYFIGGCTFAEISCLRWLSTQMRPKQEFLIATTNLTSGDEIIESLSQQFENNLRSLDEDA